MAGAAAQPIASARRFEQADYPALFQAADAASLLGQNWYRRLVKIDLSFVVLAAIIGAVSPLVPKESEPVVFALAVVPLLGAMIAKFVARQRRDDADWYNGRAVAETVKSRTWRYMMRLAPFQDDPTADREFLSQITSLIRDRANLRQALGVLPDQPRQITPRMRAVRALSLPERRDLYLTERLDDQAGWYRSRCIRNQQAAEFWFWAAIAMQFLAALLAVTRVLNPLHDLNLVGLFATLAAAFTAWAQVGRHEELSHAYGQAYQELLMIRGLAEQIESEAQLTDAIADAEGAISREHSMWVARRGEAPTPQAESE